jgi:peptidoglycan hydrolase-like protein with peptidoglycan-binding domain
MNHVDVLNLQRFLNAHGAAVVASGPGSPGSETTYFGAATKTALKKFQLANARELYESAESLDALGNFGKVTRQLVNKMQ